MATDSVGDIYVSSAGESKVRIFDPAHTELAFITNANLPCGLAVNSKGELFVSESATGKVVRYKPNAYPLTATPTYGPREEIDASGNAKGIAIDPKDDRLYVAEGIRVAVYKADGSFETSVGEPGLTKATGVAPYTTTSGDRVLFVAEDLTTDVIRIFVGTSLATLTLRETIDGSGSDSFKADETPDNGFGFGAAGAYLAVDEANGHFFVYDDEHGVVDEFEASGTYLTQIESFDFADAAPTGIAVFPQRNEVQRLVVKATGGTYTLSFEGETTAPLPHNATEKQIEEALEALAAIGTEDVAVAGRYSGAFASGTYAIAFAGDRGARNLAQLGCDATGLSAGDKTCTSTTEVQGSGPGRVYVGAGGGPGAKVLVFGPLPVPSRPPEPPPGPATLSFELTNACGAAVDSHGNRYVAADASIKVYPPSGNTPLTTINDPDRPCDLAVDSEGHVYGLDQGTSSGGDEKAVYYTPAVYPPAAGTPYSGPTMVATKDNFPPVGDPTLTTVAVNPANDRTFVSQRSQTIELDSAKNGSEVIDACFACGLSLGAREDIAVHGPSGNVSIAGGTTVAMVDAAGANALGRIDGAGSPKGPFGPMTQVSIAVDQANGHVLIFQQNRGVAEEYEASGAFVAEFGSFSKGLDRFSGIAVDNSGGPNEGNVYVAFYQETNTDLTAFGPLTYGEASTAETGLASEVGEGGARLNGTVDPRGFELDACRFEYATETQFIANGFSGAPSTPCVPGPGEIGAGAGETPVSAEVSGLDLDERHYFRIVAENEFGVSEGEEGHFGPPLLTTKPAHPIAYTEATVRATIDPSGLPTTYKIEYGTTPAYGQFKEGSLGPEAGPTDIEVPIFGLSEGTTYHFRLLVTNDAKSVEGPDQSFETLQKLGKLPCANEEFRTGRSASLPDCRAYELVTPPDTRGATPYAPDHGSTHQFNNWLVAAYGEGAGERLSFFTNVTLPGFEGNGLLDGYRAERGAGAHPPGGWESELFSPSYVEARGQPPAQQGAASDQLYAFWEILSFEAFEGPMDPGTYIGTPTGFELVGKGSLKEPDGNLKTDPDAISRFLSPGAEHVIFESDAELALGAPLAGTTALYERSLTAPTKVVSLKPDGSSFASGEDATYIGATEDGSAIVFEVGGTLYLRRAGATVKVADGPNTFAGIAQDGSRVFYTTVNNGAAPGDLFAFEAATQSATPIATDAIFAHVSADGSHVYLIKGAPGSEALYVWDGAGTEFIALLDPEDLVAIGDADIDLLRWTDAVAANAGPFIGRASSPTRSTPDGELLLFQSHANLTSFESGGHPQIYRYEVASEQILCVSCDPTGSPPAAGARLQSTSGDTTTAVASTIIPNLTEDGQAAFFQSSEQLLPEDANKVQDVYEWKAPGEDCKRQGGCLALISSGQGEDPNYLYSMTPDGRDVFFTTTEKLLSADITGSPSIYDARVEGGIPNPPPPAPCQGDACQGQGSSPAVLPAPTIAGPGDGNVQETRPRRCPKSKRKVRRNGKVRCVKKRSHHRRGATRQANKGRGQ